MPNFEFEPIIKKEEKSRTKNQPLSSSGSPLLDRRFFVAGTLAGIVGVSAGIIYNRNREQDYGPTSHDLIISQARAEGAMPNAREVALWSQFSAENPQIFATSSDASYSAAKSRPNALIELGTHSANKVIHEKTQYAQQNRDSLKVNVVKGSLSTDQIIRNS